MSDVLVFDPARRHNGDLIRDAAQLGWLPEPVFDATYGLGRFWSEYKPETLITNDLHTEADHHWDWEHPVPDDCPWRASHGTVVWDSPYKAQGRPSQQYKAMNTGYGVNQYRTMGQLRNLLVSGAVNCADLVAPGGYLLAKCQDQIVCNKFWSQTQMLIDLVTALPGWEYESWLHLSSTPRPQRSQRKPRNNYSTLLAFKRRK